MNGTVIDWLLENDNPAVAYRTRVELLSENADNSGAKAWALSFMPSDWHENNGLWYVYHLTALAECGLRERDIDPNHIRKAFGRLDSSFECGCADFMMLRALVKMGFGGEASVLRAIASACELALPDGGFLCQNKLRKLKYTPKSCYKANLHALMLASECRKRGVECGFTGELVEYFRKRNVFYRTDAPSALVLDAREGWRTVDVFFPFEVMRVGIQNVLEALCALDCGGERRPESAIDIMNSRKDADGRLILAGTFSRSYLPKERIGRPSKWATFYALLAEKHAKIVNI